MRQLMLGTLAVMAVVGAASAQAAVRYVANIQNVGTIDYTVADFITVNPTDVSPIAANCTVLPGFICTNVRFLPNPGGADTLAINYSSLLGMPFTSAGSFAPGSFAAYGSYVSLAPDMTSSLTVSQVASVPEPATWAMMLLGFGAIGATVRRRAATGKRVAHA